MLGIKSDNLLTKNIYQKMKKKSITLHLEDGNELVFINESFNYAYTEDGQTVVNLCGDEFNVTETCRVVSEMIDNLED